MLFRPVLPLLRAKHCHFLLPPSCLLVPPFSSFTASTLSLSSYSPASCHLLPSSSSIPSPLFLWSAMAAPEEGPEPLRYQVSSSHLTVQSSDLHAWAFLEANSWVLTVLVVSLADSGLEGEHTLRGLQEEGQEGAAQHRRYVLFSQSLQAVLFSESDLKDLKNEENLN